ncbi:MAG TPA: hypothetical protein VF168_06045 [Trueperaceae bacterium]
MTRPGIFWTWQDRQVEDRELVAEQVADMAAHGFGDLLVQPRGCRYTVDHDAFPDAVKAACDQAHRHGARLWLHLDPRSMARTLVEATGQAAEYLIVAGTGDAHARSDRRSRPLDVQVPLAPDGRFEIRLDYPRSRAYHVHSEGAISFRPLRLERCLAYRRNGAGSVECASVHDITAQATLFSSELSGYVDVFGRWLPPARGEWEVLALVAFASNYPDFASRSTRRYLEHVLERYAEAGARLDGIWWDEPGYCTGFDRAFRADRGRLPWGEGLRDLHRRLTGRDAADDLLFLLTETDGDNWGRLREEYYRTLQEAVMGAQEELHRAARRLLGERVRMGVHQTWHQNADDVINGCMDWWRGARLLDAGYSDVGSAEEVDDPRQMAEVRSMATLAVSLARRTGSREAYCNLWGVEYGDGPGRPSGEIVDWWVDLQATLGCNWLAHTYGPTGYFERPSVWGPGYPDHPTWERMRRATGRLAAALELAEGSLPRADVALVYPLGALYRLASDYGNWLTDDAHLLIDALLRRGYELDIVSPAGLGEMSEAAYRAVIWLHPFGAAAQDVAGLARRSAAGAEVIVAGLPPVAGAGYAGANEWRSLAGIELTEGKWPDVLEQLPGRTTPDILNAAGIEPSWSVPEGSLATRTALPDGGLLLRLCPAEFGRPFEGRLRAEGFALDFGPCRGLFCLRLGPDGAVVDSIEPEGLRWSLSADRSAV